MIFVLSLLLTKLLFIATLNIPFFPHENDTRNTALIINPVQNKEFDLPLGADSPPSPSFARGMINTNILTLFNYNGSQIYVYSSIANDGGQLNTPHKWIFYYVPIMAPLSEHDSLWVWQSKNEVRVRLMLGDSMVEEMARRAIEKKYDVEMTKYSKYWDIAPLMIDSLTAYIVQGSGSPIASVEPFHAIHPNSYVMIFRFKCSTQEQAQEIVEMLDEGDYEIEVAFYFAGFRQVSTNFVSITGDQMKGVSSKTAADGGNTKAEYIHRSQASKFISLYNTNVQKMIYSESTDFKPELFSVGMEETFTSLMKQAMDEALQKELKVQFYEQVWNSSDLSPNRITSELNKIFTLNKTATEAHLDGSTYFDVNWQQLKKSAQEINVGFWSKVSATLVEILPVSVASGLNVDVDKQTENIKAQQTVGYEAISDKQIRDSLLKHDVHVEWTGEKLEPKSFSVFKITELTGRLQTALISKQLVADKNQSAIIRVISTMNTPRSIPFNKTHTTQLLTGEVKLYTGHSTPPSPWLLCDGSAVSRIEYQRLFAVTGERYGSGDGVNTFNLPDFRGRVPLGVDTLGTRIKMAAQTGLSGGNITYQLTSSQLPTHQHSQGSLAVATNGAHSQSISDPGHDHGGQTGEAKYGPGGWGMRGSGHGSDQISHTHSIPRDYTRIQIQSAGAHTHAVYGETGSFGNGEAFTVMPPYQTINYIIYTD